MLVVDTGSLNGTYVNRKPVESVALANGDEIQMGKFRLVFLTRPHDPPSGLAVASLSVAVVAGGFGRCLVGELAWRRRAQSAAPAPQLLYLRAEFLSASLSGIMLVRFTHSATLSRERGDLLAQ